MSDIKVAVIIDSAALPSFARDAIDDITRCDSITVFACTNSRSKRRLVKHGAYYALNLLTVRNPRTRSVPIQSSRKTIARTVEFRSGYEGAWQTLPEAVVDEMRTSGFDVILKFGMGLLRVPPPDVLPVPILSYHHGDPDRFRGRPAGFWEMVENVDRMGQMVQKIGNALDAGWVAAYAETKVYPHSYRATLVEAYRHSRLLINPAIRNALAGNWLPKPCTGKNYRLPSNRQVLSFAARMVIQLLKRLLYGLLFEKRWQVSLAGCPRGHLRNVLDGTVFPAAPEWRTLPIPREYLFYADPFFSADPPGLLVEAMSRRTALGEIVLVGKDRHSRVLAGPGHYSYPSTCPIGGRQVILPEASLSGPPRAYELAGGASSCLGTLRLDSDEGVLDPTLLVHGGRLYLFGNLASIGSNALFLWSAASLQDRFERHPLSPIRISPMGGRMGGSILEIDGRLIRPGQNFRDSYGDGIVTFEIEELTPATYRERLVAELRFADRSGPHTLNWRDGELVFDWYRESVTLLAGVRRLRAHLLARREAESGSALRHDPERTPSQT